MRHVFVIALLLSSTATAQMMPQRLARTDTAAASSKTSHPTTTLDQSKASGEKLVDEGGRVGETTTPSTSKQVPTRQGPDPMSSFEFWLSVIVLTFTLLLISTQIWLIRSHLLSPDLSQRALLVTIIIGATLFLITAGYSNDQIAPAMGLFGTIAGYLLGRSTAARDKDV